jgi:HK97 family phage portal protein
MKILGLNVTRARETKESQTWTAVMSFLSGQKAVYTPANYATLTKAGYQMCAAAYSCVSLIARSASGIKWTVSTKGRDGKLKRLEKHPLLDLLARPNEYDSGYRLIEAIISYKLLAGNSYVEKVHGVQSAPPQFLYPLRPDRMKVRPGAKGLLVGGYTYTVNGRDVELEERNVLHMKDFHPLHDHYGLSRLEVAAKSIDISNWSEEWNLKLLQNDMRPPALLTLQGLAPAQTDKIRRQLQGDYSGAENAGKTMVLENIASADFKQLSISPRDADWSESDKRNLRRICSIFNIWSGLLGDNENNTFSNYQEGRKALYQETVLPEMDGLRDGLGRWLGPLYGDIILDYDRDAIEALQEDREKKYAYLEGARFMRLNEKRAAVGLEPDPDGEVILVGMGEMALSDAVAGAGDLSATDGKSFKSLPARKSLDGFWRGETERKALWRNFERRIVSKERAFAREAQAYLKAQAEGVVAKAASGVKEPERLLDVGEARKSYAEKFTPRYRRLYATAIAAGRRLVEGKLYEFDDADEKADGGWVDEETRKKLEKLIADSAKVITDETLSEIQAVMRDALGTNLTVQEIAGALQDKLVDTMAPVRARRIARTETAMLENAGSLDGFKENEFVTRKMWVCSFVEDSRDDHKEASGQEVEINDPFRVGPDLMQYPGDRSDNPNAGNVVNCLCYIAPIAE